MIKVKYNKQIHLIKVDNGFAGLQSSVRKVFKELPYRYHFVYRDEDNDEIIVDCQDDFKVLLEEIKPIRSKEKAKIVKLQVKQEIQLLSAIEDSQSGSEFIPLQNQEQENSIELLQENDIITAEEKHDDMEYVQEELLNSIQYSESSEVRSADITQMVRQQLHKMQDKLIEKALKLEQEVRQRKQVENYLGTLYQNVEKQTPEEEYKDVKDKRLNQTADIDEDLGQMIQTSLKKLLPGFIKRLSAQTIKSVKDLVQLQNTSQAHNLSNSQAVYAQRR